MQTEQTAIVGKATKVSTRQPTLPDKYGKFIQFAYYMMDNVLGDEFQMDKAAFLEKIALFGSVGEQQSLVQGFLNGAKETKGAIKTLLSDRKKALAKANKPPKQSRAKKDVPIKDANGEVAPKRARKSTPKKGVQAANAQLLDDLVQIAQTQAAEPITPPTVVAAPVVAEPVVAEEKPVKKVKAKAAKKPIVAETVVEEPAINITNELVAETFVAHPEAEPVIAKVAAAPKRKSQPKKAAKQVDQAPGTPVLDDIVIAGTDIEVSIINIDGKSYFMDDVSNLYCHPVPSAKSIGKYNPLTRKITYTN
jgi:hypothetical protein